MRNLKLLKKIGKLKIYQHRKDSDCKVLKGEIEGKDTTLCGWTEIKRKIDNRKRKVTYGLGFNRENGEIYMNYRGKIMSVSANPLDVLENFGIEESTPLSVEVKEWHKGVNKLKSEGYQVVESLIVGGISYDIYAKGDNLRMALPNGIVKKIAKMDEVYEQILLDENIDPDLRKELERDFCLSVK